MNNCKGIILAGGTGSRLYPTTASINKHLLPIYDKPMIYYPLSTLMLAGIREIEIIVNPGDIETFTKLLGDGSAYGISLSFAIQNKPRGLADAFKISKNFIGKSNCALILGDNFFYGNGLKTLLSQLINNIEGATIFGYPVKNPSDFGIIEYDNEKVISIEEKPLYPKSNFAAVGLYLYDNDVIKYADQVLPSTRGEIEITSINQLYLKNSMLKAHNLGRGYAWFDMGTYDDLQSASNFIQNIENIQKFKLACLEEISLKNGWISMKNIQKNINSLPQTPYTDYLKELIRQA